MVIDRSDERLALIRERHEVLVKRGLVKDDFGLFDHGQEDTCDRFDDDIDWAWDGEGYTLSTEM